MNSSIKYIFAIIILLSTCYLNSCASASLINKHDLNSSIVITKKINKIMILIDCNVYYNNKPESAIVVLGEVYNWRECIKNVLNKTNMFNEIDIVEKNQPYNKNLYDYIFEIEFKGNEISNSWASAAWLVSLTLFPWISEEEYNAKLSILKSKKILNKPIIYQDKIKIFHHISSPIVALFSDSGKSLRKKVHESIIAELFNNVIKEGVFDE